MGDKISEDRRLHKSKLNSVGLLCITILFLVAGANGQKTVGLSVKFTPEAPDSFETASLTLTDEEFSISIKNLDGTVVYFERFNYTNMDIETIEDLVQEVSNKLPDVFDIDFSRGTPIYVLNPNKGTIKRSPFVPFQFINNRIYEKAPKMPGSLSIGSSFYNNEGFGDTGHFKFGYEVDYEIFQIGRSMSIFLVTGMQFNSDEPDTVSESRAVTIPKDLHFNLGGHLDLKFDKIHLGPTAYFDWSIKNFTVWTDTSETASIEVKDAFYRLKVGGRASLPISVVGTKGSFVIEYLLTTFSLPTGIAIPDAATGLNLETVTGSIIRGKFPVLGSRITLGIEYIDLPSDMGLDDSLIVEVLANFSINDVAGILRRAFKI